MKLLARKAVVSLFFLFCTTAWGFAESITFTGLSPNGSAIPNGYAGFQWSNFDLMTGPLNGLAVNPGGVGNSLFTQSFAVNGRARTASFSSATQFGLASAWLATQWNTLLNIEVVGLLDGKPVHSMLVDLRGGVPQLITPNWSGIDQVRFVPRAQASAPGSMEFAVSDIVVNQVNQPVPEPATLLLLVPAIGVAATRLHILRSGK